jgi:hypothetical protein
MTENAVVEVRGTVFPGDFPELSVPERSGFFRNALIFKINSSSNCKFYYLYFNKNTDEHIKRLGHKSAPGRSERTEPDYVFGILHFIYDHRPDPSADL